MEYNVNSIISHASSLSVLCVVNGGDDTKHIISQAPDLVFGIYTREKITTKQKIYNIHPYIIFKCNIDNDTHATQTTVCVSVFVFTLNRIGNVFGYCV